MNLVQAAEKQALERVRFNLTDCIDNIGMLIQRYGPDASLVRARGLLINVQDRVIKYLDEQ